MELSVNEEIVARDATEDDIERTIRGLRSHGDDSFAILTLFENSFIQTVFSDDGFGLEYKKDDDLFGCYDELNDDVVIKAFVYYLNRDERLKTEYTWEPVEY
ncbi:MAG: hypothetical protein K1X52_06090 [Pyrinomonadaceae bacterium]|nr:hypothetical protein [Pyrinomonadaceae bacterium]